jgi:hypothetical protein
MSYDGFFVQATGNAPPLPTRKTRRSTLSVASSRILPHWSTQFRSHRLRLAVAAGMGGCQCLRPSPLSKLTGGHHLRRDGLYTV